jgi:hypothetical protein
VRNEMPIQGIMMLTICEEIRISYHAAISKCSYNTMNQEWEWPEEKSCSMSFYLLSFNKHEHTRTHTIFLFFCAPQKKLLRESFQFIFLVAQPASPASYLESVISCLYIIYIVGYMINYLCIRLFDPLICDEEFFTFTMTYRNFQSTSRDEK